MLAFLALPLITAAPPDLGWIAGIWRGEKWGGQMEEHWTAQAGGTLLGMNRMVKAEATPHREFLSIETKEGKTTLTVYLFRQPPDSPVPVTYSLTALDGRKAVFENPDHERLSRMTYRRDGNTLHILIEGRRKDQPFRDEFVLTAKE